MKKIRDFIHEDMFNHMAMSGPDIVKLFDPNVHMTQAEKLNYVKGITCVYPFMMLGNYCRWKYSDEPAPKDYEAFKNAKMPELQEKVHPMLEKYYSTDKPLTPTEKAEIFIPIYSEIVPVFMITEFYNYMYGGSKDAKNINEFIDSIRPTLKSLVGNGLLRLYFNEYETMDYRAKIELFQYIATRMAYDILRKYHDWHFGAEVITMGPPPGGGGPGDPDNR